MDHREFIRRLREMGFEASQGYAVIRNGKIVAIGGNGNVSGSYGVEGSGVFNLEGRNDVFIGEVRSPIAGHSVSDFSSSGMIPPPVKRDYRLEDFEYEVQGASGQFKVIVRNVHELDYGRRANLVMSRFYGDVQINVIRRFVDCDSSTVPLEKVDEIFKATGLTLDPNHFDRFMEQINKGCANRGLEKFDENSARGFFLPVYRHYSKTRKKVIENR